MKTEYSMREKLQAEMQDKLPELRKELSLTQKEFAELLGKSRQMISLIERKESKLTWETCLAITALAINRNPKVMKKLFGEDYKKDFQNILRGS